MPEENVEDTIYIQDTTNITSEETNIDSNKEEKDKKLTICEEKEAADHYVKKNDKKSGGSRKRPKQDFLSKQTKAVTNIAEKQEIKRRKLEEHGVISTKDIEDRPAVISKIDIKDTRNVTFEKINIESNSTDQKDNEVKLSQEIEEAADPCVKEEWQKKGGSRKRRKEYAEPKRIKTIAALLQKHEEVKRQKLETDDVIRKINIADENFKETAVTKERTIGNVSDKLYTLNHESINHENEENKCIINNINVSYNHEQMKFIEKFPNGLICDSTRYFKSSSRNILISKIRTKRSLTIEEIYLTACEFASLQENRWINGLVIDSFVAANIDEWEDFSYIPTDDSLAMVGDKSCQRINKSSRIYRTSKDLKNKILIPYLFGCHWRLIFINIEEKSFAVLDPYDTDNDFARVFETFQNFIKERDSKCSLKKLHKISWNIKEYTNRPYQEEDDGSSCGVYVLYYIEQIGTNKLFKDEFNCEQFRHKVASEILLKSVNIIEDCIHCFKSVDSDSLECDTCYRKWHKKCSWLSNIDTDEEDSQKICKEKQKNLTISKSVSNNCRICKRQT